MELLFLTEKSVAEAVYYWGNSIYKDVFELIIWLVYLEIRGSFRLHIICVARTRKIAAGIDGFSRGCLKDGIISSGSILFFCL